VSTPTLATHELASGSHCPALVSAADVELLAAATLAWNQGNKCRNNTCEVSVKELEPTAQLHAVSIKCSSSSPDLPGYQGICRIHRMLLYRPSHNAGLSNQPCEG
jgi:hypothetical protein